MMIKVYFEYIENSTLKGDTVKLGLNLNKSIDLEDTINGYLNKAERFKRITKILPLEDYGDEAILTIGYKLRRPNYTGMTHSRFLVKQGAEHNLRKLAESHCDESMSVIEIISASITTDIKDFDKLTQVDETAVIKEVEPTVINMLATVKAITYENEHFSQGYAISVPSYDNVVIHAAISEAIKKDEEVYAFSSLIDLKVL